MGKTENKTTNITETTDVTLFFMAYPYLKK